MFLCLILVTKSFSGGKPDQRGHEVSAERSGQCRQRDLCKSDQRSVVVLSHHTIALILNTPYPQSLKKKVEFLQKTLSTPTRTNEAFSRLVFERCGSSCSFNSTSCFDGIFLKTVVSYLLTTFLWPHDSPAPMNLKQPRLHQPSDSEDIDLNITYDITTPGDVSKKSTQVPLKKMCLEPPA